jgi:hypothetical protein
MYLMRPPDAKAAKTYVINKVCFNRNLQLGGIRLGINSMSNSK